MAHFYLRTKPAQETKIIISVSKKVSNSAVVRNTVKLRVRPIVREFITTLKPATYFFVANPGAQKIKGDELREELVSIIRSIRN